MPLYYSLILISELKIMVSQLTHNFGGSVKKYLLNIGADIGDAFIGLDMCSSSFYTTL